MESRPLVHLFATPNPMMSGDQLIEATFIHLGLCEEAFYIAEIAITAMLRNLSRL